MKRWHQLMRGLALIELFLLVLLGVVPFIGVCVILNPGGGDYSWMPSIDLFPPFLTPFINGWFLVSVKRLVWGAGVALVIYLASFKDRLLGWVILALLCSASGLILVFTFPKIGIATKPVAFILLAAFTVVCATTVLLRISNVIEDRRTKNEPAHLDSP